MQSKLKYTKIITYFIWKQFKIGKLYQDRFIQIVVNLLMGSQGHEPSVALWCRWRSCPYSGYDWWQVNWVWPVSVQVVLRLVHGFPADAVVLLTDQGAGAAVLHLEEAVVGVGLVIGATDRVVARRTDAVAALELEPLQTPLHWHHKHMLPATQAVWVKVVVLVKTLLYFNLILPPNSINNDWSKSTMREILLIRITLEDLRSCFSTSNLKNIKPKIWLRRSFRM